MSLVIAMKAVNGIVMAADTRGTIGDPRALTAIDDNYQKIFSLGQCGIGFAGAAEMGSTLLDELHKKGLDNFKDIDTAVGGIQPGVTNCFNNWFQNIQPADRPGVLITLAGYRYSDGLDRDSPDQTNFPGNSSFWDTVKYNPAFQGRQMRPDSLKFPVFI